MYWSVMAYLATAMCGVFLIFWDFANGKIKWVKLIIYSCLLIVSLFLTVEDILHKEQSAKDTETAVIREMWKDHHFIQRQIDSVSLRMDSLMTRKDSLEYELRRKDP